MLKSIEFSGVRNLQQAGFEFHPHLNIVCGPNASGKTSLLESIAILASGKSFRTSSLENVVNHQADYLRIFGRTESGHRLGYQWGSGGRQIRIDGEAVSRASLLAQVLPLQHFTPDTHTEFARSRRHRIAIPDWTLFHVEHGFHETWSKFRRVLAQRNAALKGNQDTRVWDKDFVDLAEKITRSREKILDRLLPYIQELGQAIPGGGDIEIRLRRGWGKERDLTEVLADDRDRDRRDGYTHSGAHRADLDVRFDGFKAREQASQGQLKTLVMVLRLSQLSLFSKESDRPSLLLLDDLPAELDQVRRDQLMAILARLPLQVFLTTTEAQLVELANWDKGLKMFHVEQGFVTVEEET